MSDLQNKVFALVSEQLAVKLEDVKLESNFIDDLGADSLDTVEFIMSLEDEFNVEITDEEAEKITTVGHVVKLVTEAEAAA